MANSGAPKDIARKIKPSVFVFRIGQLGDSLVALPAIQKIKELNHGFNIVLITDQADNENYVNSWAVFELTKVFSEKIPYN